MATATFPEPALDAAAPPFRDVLAACLPTIRGGRRAYFDGVDWETYEYVLAARGDGRPGLRIAYDHGWLELMSHSSPHERWSRVLVLLLTCVAEQLGVSTACCGHATLRRRDLGRGIEPDDWYYVGPTADRMLPVTVTRGVDLTRDPPPDLAVEIEVSRSFLDRLAICGAMGIAEVWLFDGTRLEIVRRDEAGAYQPAARSMYFPTLPPEELTRHVAMCDTASDPVILGRFRTWVREHLLPPA